MRLRHSVGILAATALGVRLLYLAEWWRTPLFDVLLGDGRRYDAWAREIAAGEWLGREAFYQAPLYPYFLATIYSLVADSLLAVRLVQFALGAVTAAILVLTARRFVSERAALAAGAILALYAPAIFYDGLVQKSALDGFLLACLLLALVEWRERGTGSLLLTAGALLGALSLTRENALLLFPIAALWILLERPAGPRERRWGGLALFFAGAALLLLPVTARNAWLSGGFLPTTSQLGPNFYIGNHAGATGRYVPLRPGRGSPEFEREDATGLAEAALGRRLSPAEVSDYWLSRAVSFAREHPGDWLVLLLRKTGLTLHAAEILDTDSIEAYEERSTLLRFLARLLHFGTLLPLAVLGIVATRREWRSLWLLHALALALAVSVALFYVMGRYRYPLVPLLAIFAGAGLVDLHRRLRSRSKAAVGRAIALVAAVGLACNWPLGAPVDPRTITWYSLGLELVESGRHEQGRAELERALELDPGFADAHVAYGTSLLAEEDARGALKCFDEAMRRDPRHAGARTGAALALLQLGDARAAEERLRQALALDPLSAEAWNDLAVALSRQGRTAEALDAAQEAVRLSPADPTLRLNLARLLLSLGRSAEARRLFDEAGAGVSSPGAPSRAP